METEERTRLYMDDVNVSKLKNFADYIWKNQIIPYINNISESDIPTYWKRFQYENMVLAEKHFDNFLYLIIYSLAILIY